MKGWRITIGIGVALIALSGAQLAIWGTGEEGLRVLIRSSARSSVLLFALAFSASALRSLWRSEPSRWLLANRRYLGVSYAFSHAIHLAALVGLGRVSQEFVDSIDAVTVIGGGLVYVFTLAMALTSSDAAVRALGRPRWRALHWAGSWYIWIVFAQSYLPRAVVQPAYGIAAVLVLAVPAMRSAAWFRRRARQPQTA